MIEKGESVQNNSSLLIWKRSLSEQELGHAFDFPFINLLSFNV